MARHELKGDTIGKEAMAWFGPNMLPPKPIQLSRVRLPAKCRREL